MNTVLAHSYHCEESCKASTYLRRKSAAFSHSKTSRSVKSEPGPDWTCSNDVVNVFNEFHPEDSATSADGEGGADISRAYLKTLEEFCLQIKLFARAFG
jgi:hypothetical protein